MEVNWRELIYLLLSYSINEHGVTPHYFGFLKCFSFVVELRLRI